MLVDVGWRRRLAGAMAAALVVASLTGCAWGVCAGPAQFPAGVWLDPSPWLATHPDSSLTACLDGTCVTADAAATSVLQLIVPYRHSPQPGRATYTLTITSPAPKPLDVRRRVTLREGQVTGPCGTVTWWDADARLQADGRLTVWHGSGGTGGPISPLVRPTGTPAATGGR
jgi:hypothetical protein